MRYAIIGCLIVVIIILVGGLLFIACRARQEAPAADQPIAASQPTIKVMWPQNGARVKVGQQFQVHAIAVDPRGIISIGIAVDGQPGTPGIAAPPISTFSAVIPFIFQTKGVHAIAVQANSTTGAKSEPATIRVVAVQTLSDPTNPGDPPAPVVDVPTDPVSPNSNQPAPSGATVNFLANPTSIAQGQCSTLRWDVEGVREIYLEGAGVTGHEQRQQCPMQTTTYTLRVVFLDGSAQDYTATVTVTGGNDGGTTCSGRPNLQSLSVDPQRITEGQSSTLSWAVTNAESVEFDHGIGTVNASGSRTISPNRGTTYTLTARCGAETVTRGVALTVDPATTFAVSNVTVSVNHASYTGPCPNTLTSGARITANGAGMVRYRWEQSDGTNSETNTIQFDAAGEKAVTNHDWQIPSPGNYWVRLHVLAPNDVMSNRGESTWACAAAFEVTSVSASVAPFGNVTAQCPKTFILSGIVAVNKAGEVKYRWVRDGGAGQTRSLTFNAAGNQRVTEEWTLNATGSHRARLEIVEPGSARSDPVEFTLTCSAPLTATLVSVSINPTAFTGSCPHTFHFTGVIRASGAGIVTYRWERSDGNSDTRTLNFSAAGDQTIESGDFKSGSSGTFWARLHVLMPNDKVSNQATFSLTCK